MGSRACRPWGCRTRHQLRFLGPRAQAQWLRRTALVAAWPVGPSPVLLVVKNPPATAGDVRDLGSVPGWKRFLEKEMATHSSILATEISWTEEPGRLQSIGPQRIGHD